MIKEEIFEIRIQSKNRKHYESIFGKKFYINQLILVESKNIPIGSHIIVTGICDFCKSEKRIKMKDYNKQTNFGKLDFCCSKKCSILKTKKSNLEKYGYENVFQNEDIKKKSKLKKLELYGNESFNNNQKASETNIKKYGFKTVLMDPEIRDDIKNSYFVKHGVYYPSQNPDILEKIKQSNIKKYGVDNYSKTKEFSETIKSNFFKKMENKLSSHGLLKKSESGKYYLKCKSCGEDFEILYTLMYKRLSNSDNICIKCNPKSKVFSNYEKSILSFLKDNSNFEIIENQRKILDGKEIDIYLPEINLALEFNGLYWHSELYKERKYHLDKTLSCIERGIDLMHIWEDDWIYKQDIVKSMILNKLGLVSNKIFARKCEVKVVDDNRIVREFLDKNHIQGFVGSKIKIGLFYENKLVSLMTFGNLRKSLGQSSQEGSYELLRFCNSLNTIVVGGASKLFKYFLNNYNVSEIISYSDLSRYKGNMYQQLGFKLSHSSEPNYYYIIDGVRKHRFGFRKDKLVSQGFDASKTETEIMNERGFYRIFDCGMQKWVFKK